MLDRATLATSCFVRDALHTDQLLDPWLGGTDPVRPRLAAEEEWALGEAVQAGRCAARLLADGDPTADERPALEAAVAAGQQARETLVLAHLWLAAYFADRVTWSGIPREDLRQEAVVGLLLAVDGYDPGRRLRFATYARWQIRAALSRALERRGLITLPKHLVPRLRAGDEPVTDDPPPLLPATTALAGVAPPPVIDTIQRARAAARPMVWLDERVTRAPLTDAVAEPQADAADLVTDLLTALDAREQTIIRLRHGLDGEPQSCRAIGDQLGISDEWVRRLERAALAKLRAAGGANLVTA